MTDDVRALFIERLEGLRGPLTAYARSLLNNREDLADVLQQTFLTAFEKYGSFLEGTDFRSWVFQILTYTVFNTNRRGRRHAASALSEDEAVEEMDAILDREWSYEEILRDPQPLFDRVGDEIAGALTRLPEKERACFLLVSVAGITTREAAGVLDIPHGSAMGYVGRARARLRSWLADYVRRPGSGKEAAHDLR